MNEPMGLEFSYPLYLGVIVANIAGNLEARDIIYVPDDENLTEAVVTIVNEFIDNDIGTESDMFDYADERLSEIYPIDEDDEEGDVCNE